jgi:hypothetical protein
MSYVHKTMIVPTAIVEQVRALAASFPSTTGMWAVAVTPEDSDTTTHYISAGMVDSDLAPLMTDHAALAAATGLTAEQAEALLGQCIVSDDEPHAVLAEHGLRLRDSEV